MGFVRHSQHTARHWSVGSEGVHGGVWWYTNLVILGQCVVRLLGAALRRLYSGVLSSGTPAGEGGLVGVVVPRTILPLEPAVGSNPDGGGGLVGVVLPRTILPPGIRLGAAGCPRAG